MKISRPLHRLSGQFLFSAYNLFFLPTELFHIIVKKIINYSFYYWYGNRITKLLVGIGINWVHGKRIRQFTKLLPLQGALLIAIIPRALPWARSFWAFSPYLNHLRNFKYLKKMETILKSNSQDTQVSVLMINDKGIMLSVLGNDYFVSYNRIPWMKYASISDALEVKMSGRNAIEWPKLDVDLEIDSLKHPERYPLIMKRNELEVL